jgi:hypothetical protein
MVPVSFECQPHESANSQSPLLSGIVSAPEVVFKVPDYPGAVAAPLAGLRLVIESADIGGKWGDWDDRSTFYRAYGHIEEGDLNLAVAKILERDVQLLGAKVFLTRRSAEPIATYDPQKLDEETREILTRQSYTLPPAFYQRARSLPANSERRFQIAKEVLFAKVVSFRSNL